MNLSFAPTARAPRGKGPRTKKQARKLRVRREAERLEDLTNDETREFYQPRTEEDDE